MCLILSPNLGFVNNDSNGVIARSESGAYFNIGPTPFVLVENDSKFASVTDSFKQILHNSDNVDVAAVYNTSWTTVNDANEIKQILKVCKFSMLPTSFSEIECCRIRIPRCLLMKTKRHIIQIKDYIDLDSSLMFEIKDIGKGEYFDGVIIRYISNCKALPSIFCSPYNIFKKHNLFFFNGIATSTMVRDFTYAIKGYSRSKALKYASKKLDIQLAHSYISKSILKNIRTTLQQRSDLFDI